MIASPLERNLPRLFYQIDAKGMNRFGAGADQAVTLVDAPGSGMAFMGPQGQPGIAGSAGKTQTTVNQRLRDTSAPRRLHHIEQPQLCGAVILAHTKDAAQSLVALMRNLSGLAGAVMFVKKIVNDATHQRPETLVKAFGPGVIGHVLSDQPVGVTCFKTAQVEIHAPSLPMLPLPIKPTPM